MPEITEASSPKLRKFYRWVVYPPTHRQHLQHLYAAQVSGIHRDISRGPWWPLADTDGICPITGVILVWPVIGVWVIASFHRVHHGENFCPDPLTRMCQPDLASTRLALGSSCLKFLPSVPTVMAYLMTSSFCGPIVFEAHNCAL